MKKIFNSKVDECDEEERIKVKEVKEKEEDREEEEEMDREGGEGIDDNHFVVERRKRRRKNKKMRIKMKYIPRGKEGKVRKDDEKEEEKDDNEKKRREEFLKEIKKNKKNEYVKYDQTVIEIYEKTINDEEELIKKVVEWLKDDWNEKENKECMKMNHKICKMCEKRYGRSLDFLRQVSDELEENVYEYMMLLCLLKVEGIKKRSLCVIEGMLKSSKYLINEKKVMWMLDVLLFSNKIDCQIFQMFELFLEHENDSLNQVLPDFTMFNYNEIDFQRFFKEQKDEWIKKEWMVILKTIDIRRIGELKFYRDLLSIDEKRMFLSEKFMLMIEKMKRGIEISQDIVKKVLELNFFMGKDVVDKIREIDLEKIKKTANEFSGMSIRLAFLGCAKAGKSLLVNALMDSEILPSRNAMCTSCPFVMKHDPNLEHGEVEFELNDLFLKNINELITETISLVENDLIRMDDLLQQEKFSNFVIKDKEDFKQKVKLVKKVTKGKLNVTKTLYVVNDIIRTYLTLYKKYDTKNKKSTLFEDLTDIRFFPTIKMKFPFLKDHSYIHEFLLIDFPGINDISYEPLKKLVVKESNTFIFMFDFNLFLVEGAKGLFKFIINNSSTSSKKFRLFLVGNKYDIKYSEVKIQQEGPIDDKKEFNPLDSVLEQEENKVDINDDCVIGFNKWFKEVEIMMNKTRNELYDGFTNILNEIDLESKIELDKSCIFVTSGKEGFYFKKYLNFVQENKDFLDRNEGLIVPSEEKYPDNPHPSPHYFTLISFHPPFVSKIKTEYPENFIVVPSNLWETYQLVLRRSECKNAVKKGLIVYHETQKKVTRSEFDNVVEKRLKITQINEFYESLLLHGTKDFCANNLLLIYECLDSFRTTADKELSTNIKNYEIDLKKYHKESSDFKKAISCFSFSSKQFSVENICKEGEDDVEKTILDYFKISYTNIDEELLKKEEKTRKDFVISLIKDILNRKEYKDTEKDNLKKDVSNLLTLVNKIGSKDDEYIVIQNRDIDNFVRIVDDITNDYFLNDKTGVIQRILNDMNKQYKIDEKVMRDKVFVNGLDHFLKKYYITLEYELHLKDIEPKTMRVNLSIDVKRNVKELKTRFGNTCKIRVKWFNDIKNKKIKNAFQYLQGRNGLLNRLYVEMFEDRAKYFKEKLFKTREEVKKKLNDIKLKHQKTIGELIECRIHIKRLEMLTSLMKKVKDEFFLKDLSNSIDKKG